MREVDDGFTLVEILISIVLVGVLAAVVVVGIGRLTDTASTASCASSSDAARVAANTVLVNTGAYPTTFTEMTRSEGGAAAVLVLPSGASESASQVSFGSWTLTMSPGSPPTFVCSAKQSASTPTTPTTPTTTPTTTATTTATTLPGNRVTAVASTDHQPYFGTSLLTVRNVESITAMSITISIAQTTGITYHGQYTNFWSGTTTSTNATSGGVIRYSFDLASGLVIVPGEWTVAAQFGSSGVAHPVQGDTWVMTTTSGGLTRTISGTF